MSDLSRAIEIAAKAHRGQVDKAGEPYIRHVINVIVACNTDEEEIVAALHDVVEDTAVTLEDLQAEGFSNSVLEAVEAITRQPGERYFDYIRRLKQNPLAREVKFHDLLDNLSRLGPRVPGYHSLVERYNEAYAMINV